MANKKPINPYPTAGEPFPFWGQPVYIANGATSSQFGVQEGEYYCPGFTGSTYAKSIQDKVYIAVPFDGNSQPYTPGILIDVIVTDKKRDVDKKKAAGNDGARLTVHGIDPGQVDIKVLIWTPEQYRQLRIMWSIIGPRVTKTKKTSSTPITTQVINFQGNNGQSNSGFNNTVEIPTGKTIKKTTTLTTVDKTPFDVQHPTLDDYNIKSVLFTELVGPQINRDRSRVWTMKGIEYLAPSTNNVTRTPVASKGSVNDPPVQQTAGTNTKNWGPP